MQHKIARGARRAAKLAYKNRDRARTASRYAAAGRFRKIFSRKGKGRALKYKGETMPTAIALNDACSKGWAAVCGNHRETMAARYIYDAT